jgi:radical SAM superfamily enzyme YgiQ (UPF0313 family)
MGDIDFEDVLAADLVGVSTITSTAPRAYAIADELRAKGKTVILGGPHVSFLPDEALDHADFVVRGEGEVPFRQFLAAWEGDRDFSRVEALTYRTDAGVVHTERVSPPVPMSQVPVPDHSLNRSRPGFVRGFLSKKVVPIQTTRGCPYDCTFCSVTQMFGRRVRYREVEEVIAELRGHVGKGSLLFFYDDNFVVRKEWTRRLLERMIEEKLDLQWTAQVRADVAKDPEFLRLMRRSGCFLVYIGFESVNERALEGADKAQTVAGIERAIRELKKAGIKIHGMFVLGFDEDTYLDTMTTLRFAVRRAISTVQFLILTPLPGSATFAKLKEEGRILFTDWGLYDGHHVVFRPKRLSVAMLQKAQIKAHRRFYSWRASLRSLLQWRFYKAAIAWAAGRTIHEWIKGNRAYLRAIKLIEKAGPFELRFDIRLPVRGVAEKIEAAWKRLAEKRLPEPPKLPDPGPRTDP